jgi:hypothetical protein
MIPEILQKGGGGAWYTGWYGPGAFRLSDSEKLRYHAPAKRPVIDIFQVVFYRP